MKVICHKDLSSPALRQAWNALETYGIATTFQRLHFTELMNSAVLPAYQSQIRVFQVMDEAGQTAMILPMLLHDLGRAKALEWLDLGLADYVLPLLRKDLSFSAAQMQNIWQQILGLTPEADFAHLSKMPQEFDGSANPLLQLPPVAPMGTATYPRFLRSEEDITAFRKSGIHDDYRKRVRKLTREGHEPNWLVAKTAAEGEALFTALVSLRKDRFAKMGRVDGLQDQAVHDFYMELAKQGCVDGSICLIALKFKDEIVAVQYGLVAKDRCVVIMVGAETEKWRTASPGLINFVRMVDWTIEQGLQVYDLGVGDLAYKKRFSTEPCALFEGHFPLTVKGHVYVSVRKARRKVRLYLEKHPELRARVHKLLRR